MRRLYLELKNLRFYYFVPLVVLFILVPLTVLAALKQYGDSFPSFSVICQLYIPCFSPWWSLFILKDYLNSPGKEVLFVYKQRRDSLLGKTIILWVLYVLHILAVFFAATFLFDFVLVFVYCDNHSMYVFNSLGIFPGYFAAKYLCPAYNRLYLQLDTLCWREVILL